MRMRLSQQRGPWVAVVAIVLLGHVLVTEGIASRMRDMSASDTASIKRLEAEYVADMKLTDPPVMMAQPVAPLPVAAEAEAAEVATEAASKPKPAKRPKQTKPAPPPAAEAAPSEAVAAASAPEQVAALEAPASAAASAPQASQAASKPASADSAPTSTATGPAFEWPLATRVRYKITGNFRGEVHGSAVVEWIKRGDRYQVHNDFVIGPSFAPIGSRRFTSDGLITPEGLVPERFESIDKLLIKNNPPKLIHFSADEVELPSGEKVAKLPGVQDPASHYIQLSYQFIQKPGLLKVGTSIPVPLAWPKRQEMIAYDVLAEEMLDTPMGKLNTFRLKPRRMNDMKMDALAEIWVAPSLQYLPIKFYAQQGPETFLELVMDRAPQQLNGDPGR
jgi:Protein of unknown function (DUF3108)